MLSTGPEILREGKRKVGRQGESGVSFVSHKLLGCTECQKKSSIIKPLFMYCDGAKEQRRKQEEQRSSSLLVFDFLL